MAFTTLIDTETVAQHVRDMTFAIVDCRFNLHDLNWGEQQYLIGHLPAAVYADLERDLSGEKTGVNGRHPLPEAEALTRALGRLGIDSSTQVVAYDQDSGSFASRLWWLLRWMGHDAVAVLDGGFAKWLREGRPIKQGRESRAARAFAGTPCQDMIVTVDFVANVAGKSDWLVIDARAPERYRGEIEPIDRVPGHIPGAVNHFFKWNIGEDGTFRPIEDLRTRLHQATGHIRPEHIVSYCGSGVTACHNLLALEHAGLRGAKLYPGSWSEWSSDPSRPVAKQA